MSAMGRKQTPAGCPPPPGKRAFRHFYVIANCIMAKEVAAEAQRDGQTSPG
jgi:hypothetical protein